MDTNPETTCMECGALLRVGGTFCEYCGALVATGAFPDQEVGEAAQVQSDDVKETVDKPEIKVDTELPDVDVPPALGRALSQGWNIVCRDFWESMLVGFLFLLVTSVVNSVLPLIGYIIFVVLRVGVIGWADSIRKGSRSESGKMFNIGFDRFSESGVLGLIVLIIGIVVALPILMVVMGLIGSVFSNEISNPEELFQIISGMSIGLFLFLIIWITILVLFVSPILHAYQMLTGWAIVQGRNFSESSSWAIRRIRRHFFDWWLAGFVITWISGIGTSLCYVGIFFTLPLGIAAWTVIVSDKGEKHGSG